MKLNKKQIETEIAHQEAQSLGEIRVAFITKRRKATRNISIIELARAKFLELGMNGTHLKTGILLYIDVSRKEFQILADIGINSKISETVWQNITEQLRSNFVKNEYSKGIITAIQAIGDQLKEYFPRNSQKISELDNKIEINV